MSIAEHAHAEAVKPVENTSTPDTFARFHLSLNVAELQRSIAFYRVLFGLAPAKVHDDYAKFELAEPPLVMSLVPHGHAGGGALNHVGFRLADAQVLVATQARLEMAGFKTQREDGVECCYARQTKFWVTDPDNTLWELYILHEDIDEPAHDHGPRATTACAPDSCAPVSLQMPGATATPKNTWQHLLIQPLPQRIDREEASVDEVHLQGTFNVAIDADRQAAFLAEVRRVLRPGGRVLVHGLAADRVFTGKPSLPGPAALVEHVPLLGSIATALAEAGFSQVEYLKVGKTPCFIVAGIEMRELQLAATKR